VAGVGDAGAAARRAIGGQRARDALLVGAGLGATGTCREQQAGDEEWISVVHVAALGADSRPGRKTFSHFVRAMH
jgi:hypothetical protein